MKQFGFYTTHTKQNWNTAMTHLPENLKASSLIAHIRSDLLDKTFFLGAVQKEESVLYFMFASKGSPAFEEAKEGVVTNLRHISYSKEDGIDGLEYFSKRLSDAKSSKSGTEEEKLVTIRAQEVEIAKVEEPEKTLVAHIRSEILDRTFFMFSVVQENGKPLYSMTSSKGSPTFEEAMAGNFDGFQRLSTVDKEDATVGLEFFAYDASNRKSKKCGVAKEVLVTVFHDEPGQTHDDGIDVEGQKDTVVSLDTNEENFVCNPITMPRGVGMYIGFAVNSNREKVLPKDHKEVQERLAKERAEVERLEEEHALYENARAFSTYLRTYDNTVYSMHATAAIEKMSGMIGVMNEGESILYTKDFGAMRMALILVRQNGTLLRQVMDVYNKDSVEIYIDTSVVHFKQKFRIHEN